MTPERLTVALRNLTTLVQFASVKRGLRDDRINKLAVILADVKALHQLAPEAVTADLAEELARAAKTLGVDLSGKR